MVSRAPTSFLHQKSRGTAGLGEVRKGVGGCGGLRAGQPNGGPVSLNVSLGHVENNLPGHVASPPVRFATH